MTAQAVPYCAIPDGSQCGPHLTEDQFGELLAFAPAEGLCNPHVLGCERCAGELTAMREALGDFRDASRAHADDELRRLPPMTLPSRRMISPAMQPAWWLAAAAMLVTALLPMQMQRLHGHAAAMTSAGRVTTMIASPSDDEALLEDVDREASASLPTPMQALANPSTDLNSSTPLATQRKD